MKAHKGVLLSLLLMSLSSSPYALVSGPSSYGSSASNPNLSSSNAWNKFDDPSCTQTKGNMEAVIQQKRQNADNIREKTATDPQDILTGLKSCVDGLGANFNNNFGIPTNLWGSLQNSACNYITKVFSDNPLSNAVNQFNISDPTGNFTYNPSLRLGQNNGELNQNTDVFENDVSSRVSSEIINKLPGSQEVWKGISINPSYR